MLHPLIKAASTAVDKFIVGQTLDGLLAPLDGFESQEEATAYCAALSQLALTAFYIPMEYFEDVLAGFREALSFTAIGIAEANDVPVDGLLRARIAVIEFEEAERTRRSMTIVDATPLRAGLKAGLTVMSVGFRAFLGEELDTFINFAWGANLPD